LIMRMFVDGQTLIYQQRYQQIFRLNPVTIATIS
jgi:hypothetical protein